MSYQVGEIVLYGTEGICRVLGTEEKRFGSEALTYYALESVGKGSRIFVPFANEALIKRIRRPQTADSMQSLLEDVQSIEDLDWHENDRERKTYHMGIVANGGTKELLQLIKTIQNRRVAMQQAGKRLYATDDRVCKEALTLLIAEMTVSLSVNEEAAKQHLVSAWELFGMTE